VLCGTLDGRLDAVAHAVEHNDLAQTRHLERDGVDGHAFQDLEELVLDVERRQRLVRQRLQPTLDALEQVVVQNRLLQMVPIVAPKNGVASAKGST
jgi:hypothetical protein